MISGIKGAGCVKIIAAFLIILTLLSPAADLKVFSDAEQASETTGNDNVDTPEQEELSSLSRVRGAVLVDAKTMSVMYEKNSGERLPTGVFSKLMTALIAIEMLGDSYDKVITVPAAALSGVTGEHMELKKGEELSVADLLYGLIIFNAGDAARTLSLLVAEDFDSFVGLMNEKAEELGMSNTLFSTPDGADDKGYITAKDAALLSRYAYTVERYTQICSQTVYKIPQTNKHEERVLYTRNYFLSKLILPYYYMSEVNGLCAAYTNDSGCCLAATARISDRDYICVILNADRDSNAEMYSFFAAKELLLWGDGRFKDRTLLSKDKILGEITVRFAQEFDHVAVVPEKSISLWLPKNDDITANTEIKTKIYYDVLTAPISEGYVVGEVEVLYNGKSIGKTELVTYRSLSADSSEKGLFEFIELITGKTFIIISCSVAVLLLGGVLIKARIKYIKDNKNN